MLNTAIGLSSSYESNIHNLTIEDFTITYENQTNIDSINNKFSSEVNNSRNNLATITQIYKKINK